MQTTFGGAQSGSTRMRRPTVRDPRLIVGILLIAFSVWLGMWAVNSAKDLKISYVANKALLPGQQVSQADLNPVEVNLGQHGAVYLSQPLEEGAQYFVTNQVAQGELVAASDFSQATDLSLRVIAIPTTSPLAQDVAVGDTVELWRTESQQSGGTEAVAEAQQVAKGLIVYQLPDRQSGFSAATNNVVHVLVQESMVSAVLTSVQGATALALVGQPSNGNR